MTYIQVPRNEAENVVAMRELYSCKTQQAGSKASALANSLFETQMSKTSPIAPGSKTLQGSIIHFSDAVRSAHLPAAVVPDTADLSGAVPSTVRLRLALMIAIRPTIKRQICNQLLYIYIYIYISGLGSGFSTLYCTKKREASVRGDLCTSDGNVQHIVDMGIVLYALEYLDARIDSRSIAKQRMG